MIECRLLYAFLRLAGAIEGFGFCAEIDERGLKIAKGDLHDKTLDQAQRWVSSEHLKLRLIDGDNVMAHLFVSRRGTDTAYAYAYAMYVYVCMYALNVKSRECRLVPLRLNK